MVVEIKKNASAEEVRYILRRAKSKRRKKSSLTAFFGKLPKIEDGLKYQKRVRNEWK